MEVSVLLPARNAASTVEAAVRSTLDDLRDVDCELICVDDRSTDATPARLRALAEQDPRIRILPGEGRGISAALNLGLTSCRAPLVSRMDADDEWLPGRWASQRASMAEASLTAVGGAVEIFSDGPVGEGMQQYARWLNGLHTPEELARNRYIESPIVHPASLIRRAALLEVGGWREGPFPEDYALWLELFSRGHRLANVEATVLRWRDSSTRLTRTDPRYSLDAHAALKAEHLAREPFCRRPVRIAGAGPTGLRLARALRARGVELREFVEVHPRKIGMRIERVPVIGYNALGPPEGAHLLVAVGIPSAREEVRQFLSARGWLEGRDFTCCA